MMSSVNPAVNSQANVSATSASGQTGFADTEHKAQLFVDIYNGFLQDSPAPTSTLTAPGASSSNLLLQLLNSQQASKTSNGKTLVDNLDAIGIEFEQPSTPNATGQLTLDTTKLESAFTADESGTQAVVSQAVQSIGQISSKFSTFFVPDFSSSLGSSFGSNSGSNTGSLFGSSSASPFDLFSQNGSSNSGDLLGGLFNSDNDTSSIWDTFSQSPQLTAAQILGTFKTGGQSGSTSFLSAFNSNGASSSIFDLFSQSPQLTAAAILGTLPQVPKSSS